MDHILPKSAFPDLEDDFENHVLCCASCNTMKGTWNPLKENEDARQMILQYQAELILRIRNWLDPKISARTKQWHEVRDAIAS
jgi:hypothetical protein